MYRIVKNLNLSINSLQKVFQRNFAAKKRFYKNTNIVHSGNGKYEVTLDHRKLKTPYGTPFVVNGEPLAIAVATEWSNQIDVINQPSMHLTSLCNTAIDNPNHLQKVDIVNYILNYMATDTVIFQSQENDDLYAWQSKEWDPVIDWFNKQYEVDIKKCRDILTPHVSPEAKMNIGKYLSSYDTTALHGFISAVDTLKSVILALACINRYITVERAVHLSCLEEEFQLKFWGRVEWAHDLSQQDLQARLAAAVLFIHFNSSSGLVKQKLVNE